jgi:hypothetical protein
MLRLQRRRGGAMSSWFQLGRPILERITTLSCNYSPVEVANTVIAHFREMEDWWEHKAIGPHISIIKMLRRRS